MSRWSGRRSLLLIFVGMVGLGLGIGGSLGIGAVIAGQGGSSPVHACVNEHSSRTRIVDGPEKCDSNEAHVDLSDAASSVQREVLAAFFRLEDRIAALETRVPECLDARDGDAVFLNCNVYIQNGEGSTDTANGTGNLILGYNEQGENGEDRSGSHNLVIGPEHSYSSYGGLVAGINNTVSAANASVSGGIRNTARGPHASVTGGAGNIAEGEGSSVTGGDDNLAFGLWSSISGGESHFAEGSVSSITSGIQNHTIGHYSSITGGASNLATGDFSTVSGGRNAEAEGTYHWAAGGLYESF